LLNLNERPITQKANFGNESINNTIFGFNGNYSTKVPLLTRLANKLPNIDTDVESNVSLRGEFAYLAPGAPNGTDLNGEATSYIDDFEGSQNGIDLKAQQSWFLSSRPLDIGNNYTGIGTGLGEDMAGIQSVDHITFIQMLQTVLVPQRLETVGRELQDKLPLQILSNKMWSI